jgi:hypothetical protein
MPRFHFHIVEDVASSQTKKGKSLPQEMLYAGKQWKPALQLPGMRSFEGARAGSL